ncbi:Ig-like domain-containing protein [Jannaschia seohaensis]|uniref:Ca2+-binding RTX toxin-like protein n=1 Tax=Jannaschia seohaensis TaxID=475081 RepID=A0A2Y9B6Q8_9RHOB|nr:hypothetical protein [Jannaschia seohaensis]PWJ10192.1 Ca2+-binding RTX toxin-like protein [Jannaschia seohaensis]SSA51765.1 Ca2+-binding protein, RTX toxin-related [Jannaschia seohaensis]
MDGISTTIGTAKLGEETSATLGTFSELYDRLKLEEERPLWIRAIKPVVDENAAATPLGKSKLKKKVDKLTEKRDGIQEIREPLSELIAKDADAETILKTLKAIPHPTLRKIINSIDLSKDSALTAVETIEETLTTIEETLNSQIKFFGRLDKALKLAGYVITIRGELRTALEEEIEVWGAVEARVVPALETLTAPPGEGTVIDLRPGLDAFAARVEDRRALAEDAIAFLDAVEDAIDSATNGAADAAGFLLDAFRTGLDAVDTVLDTLTSLDIPDVGAVMKPINGALGVLDAVGKVIQPVIDFFGPITRLINEAFEKVEKALGLDTLEQRVRGAVEDAIDAVVDPILDEMNEIIDDLIAALQEPFERLEQTYQDLARALTDVLVDRPASAAGVGGDATEALIAGEGGALEFFGITDNAILVGTDTAETIALVADGSEDDGWSGFAAAGGGGDSVEGTEGRDLILAGAGDDTVRGRAGDDQIVGGAGEDQLFGGEDDDEIDGGAEADLLFGGAGDDTLAGGDGADQILGGAEDDSLIGGDGADTLQGGMGDDTMEGGAGADTFVSTGGTNLIFGGEGLDTVVTLSETGARHRLVDATAELRGGAGIDEVVLGDAFARGTTHEDGVSFDAGSGRDAVEASDFDLTAFAGRFSQFETLRIAPDGAGAGVLRTDAASLAGFDGLEMSGAGALRLEVSGAAFDMNALYGGARPFLFDVSQVARQQNPHDGAKAGQNGFATSTVYDLTLARAEAGMLQALSNQGAGFRMEGSDGADTLIGGSGSDILRGGLGADLLDGGRSDDGDRFDLEGASGDVYFGTPEEFDGDTIRNLTNRVDSVRIEIDVQKAEDYTLTSTSRDGFEVVTFTSGDTTTTFRLEGSFPKLTSAIGDYVNAAGETVRFVEIFNNNIPPTARGESVETAWSQDGVAFDPFLNDFDVDTEADPENGIAFRQIALPESIADLFQVVETVTEDDKREAFANGTLVVTPGDELVTDQGNLIRVAAFEKDPETGAVDYELVYIAREQTLPLRRFEYEPPQGGEELGTGDALPVNRDRDVGGLFDPTEDLPFFGRDRLSYQVFDLEGELSREVSLNFLIRPDLVDAEGTVIGTPTVTVQEIAEGALVDRLEVSLSPVTESDTGTRRTPYEEWFTSRTGPVMTVAQANVELATATGGNDLFRIAELEPDSLITTTEGIPIGPTYRGFEGNDVLDGRGSIFDLRLFGGDGADWLEGGDGDDSLFAGGLDDEIIAPSLRVARVDDDGDPLPFTARPDEAAAFDVLLGGAGENLYTSNAIGAASELPEAYLRARDVLHVLDPNGIDMITGPMGVSNSTLGIGMEPSPAIGPAASTATALQDDTIVGFGNDDTVFVPLNLQGLRTSFFETDRIVPSSGLPGEYVYDITTQFDLAFVDMTQFEGRDAIGVFGDLGLDKASGTKFLSPTPSIVIGGFPGTAALRASHALTFDLSASGNDFGTDASTTTVTATIGLFEADYIGDSLSDPSGDAGRTVPATADIGFRTKDEILDPLDRTSPPGQGLQFSFEMMGRYDASKFELRLVDLPDLGDPQSTGDVGALVETEAGSYRAINANHWSGPGDYLGLEITYAATEPEAVDDEIFVIRDRPATIDVLANDIDEDGDRLKVWEVRFDSAEDAARLQDGDLANGEIIQETDPNDGLGTGTFTVVAPEGKKDEIVRFGYVATDGITLTDTAWVEVTEVTPPPLVSDDAIVLPAAEVFEGIRIPLTRLFANDVAPEGGSLDPATFEMVVDLSDGTDGSGPGIFVDGADLVLTAGKVEELAVNPVGRDGRGGQEVRLDYTLAGSIPGLRSDPARAVITMAQDLAIGLGEPVTVDEDGSVAVDLSATRTGGFGELSFSIGEILGPDGIDPEAGRAVATETGFVFAPAPDANATPLGVTVIATDETGQKAQATVAIQVLPVPDDPELRATPDGPVLTAIAATEDEGGDGTLFAVDPDPGEIASLLALDPIETEEGGLLTFAATERPGEYRWVYIPEADFEGSDAARVTLSSAGTAVQVSLDIEVAGVNDAPRLPGDAEIGVDVEGEARILLLEGAVDVDGEIDAESLDVQEIGDASAISWSVVEGAEGPVLVVTGAAPGAARLSYSLADDDGSVGTPRVLDFAVNAPPETVEDTFTATSRAPILIDAIANDSDLEGPIDYVRENGVPIVIDPADSFGFTLDEDGNPVRLSDAPGLQGSVAWDAELEVFVYTPPRAVDFRGTDVFFYEVVDEAGAVTRQSVLIDLLRPGEAVLRMTDTSDIVVTEAPETLVAAEAGARLEGTLAQFDGDEILAFRDGSELLLTDVPRGSQSFDIARRFDTEGLAPLDVAGLGAAPSLGGLFGDAPLDALTAAFVGQTVVDITGPSGTSTLTFFGAVVGGVQVLAEGDGTLIRYRDSNAPSPRGDDLRGGPEADEIDGGGGNDLIDGAGGPDTLSGGAGRDVLVGGPGANVLTGGAGADLFLLTGGGTATITDYDPAQGDRLAITDGRYLTGDLRVDPALVALVGEDDGWRLEGTLEGAPTEILAHFDIPDRAIRGDGAVAGTQGADVIATGDGRDQVRALSGDDLVTTHAGDDRLEGGPGDDSLNGGPGADTLVADGGDDVLTGGEGPDVFAFLRAGTARVVVRDYGDGDKLALDDRFFGLGDADFDPRPVTGGQVEAALRSGLAIFDSATGRLQLDPDGRGGAAPLLTIELGAGQRLDPGDILLF